MAESTKGVRVEQSVTVTDAEGKDAHELKATNGMVRIQQAAISFKPPEVSIEDLREAVDALRALRED